MNKDIRHLCAAVLDGQIPLAEELARRLTAPRRSSKPRSKRPARVEKAAKRQGRKEQRSAIRAQAMERDGGCVIPTCWNRGEPHMHHLAGRHREALDTVAMTCGEHHRAAHAGDAGTLRALYFWARRRGYSMAADAINRRMAKIEESRASRPERGTT